jgi:hypothetical protein
LWNKPIFASVLRMKANGIIAGIGMYKPETGAVIENGNA